MTPLPKIISTVDLISMRWRFNVLCAEAVALNFPDRPAQLETPVRAVRHPFENMTSDVTDGLFNSLRVCGENINTTPSFCFPKNDDDKKRIHACTYNNETPVRNVRHPKSEGLDVLVADPGLLDIIAQEIGAADVPVALDIETYREGGKGGALSPYQRDGQIRLLSLCIPGRDPWLLDLRAIGYDLGPLKDVLEAAEVIGHNLKFDLLWLRVKCGLNIRKPFCTMTASRLLTSGSKEPNDLGAVIERHLSIKLPKDQGRSDWGGMLLTADQLAYAANDVRHLHSLRAALDKAVDADDLRPVADLEMRLIPVVVDIEATGFPVDSRRFQQISRDSMLKAAELDKQIKQIFNNNSLNVSSPIQLKAAFEKIGITVPDTAVEALSEIDHESARLVLEYRGHEKVAQQANSLMDAVSGDGCIHARFEPTGTETGRFSSRDPNLQNVGRGELRQAFVAPEGKVLIVADYSQIELRAAAAIAGDQAMLDAYNQGADLHRKTAGLVLSKPDVEVTKNDRQISKALNFGLLYGQSAKGLVKYAKTAYGVTITEEEAKQFRDRFFVSYRGLASWHRKAWRVAGEIGGMANCEVRTRLGRRRILPRGGEDWPRFTALVNNSVQGTCADGLKLAMIELGERLPDGVQMIATVHDELVFTAPEALAEQVKTLAVEVMKTAMGKLLPEVPVEVEAKICSNWGEK